ncbi:hypothetical protein D3C85_1136300 [compost metagenome]
MVIFNKLFQIPRIQDTIDINQRQPSEYLFYECWIDNAVYVANCHLRFGDTSDPDRFYPKIRRWETVTEQSQIRTQHFNKAFPCTTDHLFSLWLCDRSLVHMACTENKCIRYAINKKSCFPFYKSLDNFIQLRFCSSFTRIKCIVQEIFFHRPVCCFGIIVRGC